MKVYWAEISEDKIIFYSGEYLRKTRRDLLWQLERMRENYKRHQSRVVLSPKKKEILESNGIKVLKDTFLALNGQWHWFTGYSREDAFRLTLKAEEEVNGNGFLEIIFSEEKMAEEEIREDVEISFEDLREAYKKALESSRVVEDYTCEVGKTFKERGFLEPLEVFYFICWKSPLGAKIPNTWLIDLINDRDNVKKITQEALKLAEQDRIREAIEKLISLRGVKVRVASAILTFYNPDRFGVIDKFAWKALYGEDKEDFTSKDYIKYLAGIRKIATKYRMRAREVDLALWEMGKRN